MKTTHPKSEPKIVTVPNPVLKKPTRPVTKFDERLQKLIRKMKETLKAQRNPEGVGLAANQIGIGLRVAIVRLNPEETNSSPNFLAIVNPKITKHSRKTGSEHEGCLSVPRQYIPIERFETITIEAQDLQGQTLKIKASGFLARIFQHEIDHLNGRLITGRAMEKTRTE
ncbi:MAG: peptide deformylase [Patescibacteria group bacterium]|nr:MAG: peptide deformylase [Patescibacteria group bacterium]